MNVKIPFIKFLKENGIFSNELEYIMNYYKYNNQLNMKQFINQKLKEISPYFLSNNFFKNFVKNDDKKIISNLLKIFNIYHRNLKQIKFSYLYKWLIKANKIKINNNNNNSNKIKSKSQRNILFHKNIKQLNLNTDRLYEDYKFKELYLNNMNVLNQFTEGNKCTFQPYINNNSNNYYINTLIKNKNNNSENFRFNSVNNIRRHTNNNNYSIDKLNNNNSIETFSDYNQTTISNYNNNKNYNNKYKKRIYNTITNNNYNDDIYKNNIKHNNLIFKNYSKYNLSKNSNYIDEKKKSKLNFSLNDYIYYNKFYDLINKMTIYPKFNNYNNNINNNRKNENKGFLTSRISKKKLSNISFNIKDSILNDNNFPPEEFKFKLNKKIKSEKKFLNTHNNNNNNKINKNINYEGTEDSMNLQTTKIKNTIGPFNLGTNSNSSFQNNTTNTMYNNNINYNNNNNYNSHNKKNYLIYEKNLDSIKSKISNTSNYTYSKDENSLEIFDNNKNIKISYNNNNNNNNYINNNDNDNNNNNKYFNNIYNQISNEHFNINNNIYQDHNKKFTETSSNLEVSATYPKVTSINFYEENEKKMFKQADNMLKASDDNYSINKFLDSYNKFKK